MPMIDLRTMRADEAVAVRDLILDVLNAEYGMALSLDELPDLVDAHRTYIASGDGHFWVALLDGRIAGCIGVLRLSGADFELRRMYVRPDCRGMGIAQRLLDRLLDWSSRRGVRCLYLETNARWHAAHHIYEKHGFVPVARDALPPEFPVVRVATGFYRRCVAPSPDPTTEPR
jgi:GNAT superfamily N-acetyltransferase